MSMRRRAGRVIRRSERRKGGGCWSAFVDIEGIVGQNATTAVVTTDDGTQFVGDARRQPGDRFNAEEATRIAAARALMLYADALLTGETVLRAALP